MATPPDLLPRVHRFNLASMKFYRSLPKRPEAQVPGVQYLRAATGVEANYRAARRARSRPEFIAKLGTVVEESDETVGWLELMRDGQIASDPALLSETKQLCAIFTTSLATARRNARAR